jgi:hypothetical protein
MSTGARTNVVTGDTGMDLPSHVPCTLVSEDTGMG